MLPERTRPRLVIEPMGAILVIEDDGDTRHGLAECLAIMFPGSRVMMSESAEAGLELARRSRPDVVLLDLGLRGIHGFEFAERLRQDAAKGGTIAIVALTGDESPDTLMRAEAAGFAAFLRKPADVDRLETVLRPFLG
jgi:CheY-like chemotaxis protein